MNVEQLIFLLVVGGLLLLLAALTSSKRYSLNRIKAKTVGDGQHGTAQAGPRPRRSRRHSPVCRSR